MKIQVKALAIMLSMGLILATGCGKASENIASNDNENDSVYANTKTYYIHGDVDDTSRVCTSHRGCTLCHR